jgi:hypothetical protein
MDCFAALAMTGENDESLFPPVGLLLQNFGPCVPSRMADASHIMVTTLAPLPVSVKPLWPTLKPTHHHTG